MFCVTYAFIHTCPKLILAQLCIEEINMFDVTHVLIHAVPKLIIRQVCIE